MLKYLEMKFRMSATNKSFRKKCQLKIYRDRNKVYSKVLTPGECRQKLYRCSHSETNKIKMFRKINKICKKI